MIGQLRGQVVRLLPDQCVVDVAGVGFRVLVPASTRERLAVGATATLVTHLQVREDALTLFGFATDDEYQLFLALTSVTGIGPKVALGVLSAVAPADFRLAVALRDLAVLTRIPGIGRKTAERLVLELKDKIGLPESAGGTEPAGPAAVGGGTADDPAATATQALAALGYGLTEIAPALRRAAKENKGAEEMIRAVLKDLGGRP